MTEKMTRAMKKELNGRVKALPRDYQTVWYEISKYLWQFASSDAGVLTMQHDILEMFETRSKEGKSVFDVVGHNVIGFCDELLGEVPEHTWIGKMKAARNESILKKISGRKVTGDEHRDK